MGDEVQRAIEGARRGDRSAFAGIVRTYQRRVFMTAYRLMGSPEDADDVAQEVFLRAYRALASFDGRCDFFTWLYRIVVNVSLNQLRRIRRQRTVPLEEVALPEALRERAGDDPRLALEMKRMVQDVTEALDELSDILRTTAVLVIVEGMSYREAAGILECSEGTVAWRVHEARQQLRQRLGQHLAAFKGSVSKDELRGDPAEAIDVRR